MRKIIIATITLALFISVSARPANHFDPFLSRLQGAWNGEGTAFGAKATVQQKVTTQPCNGPLNLDSRKLV